ncbi:MAG TPA: hypothetical protein VE954_30150 [Oligoflexus sp.]|uniref:hypothetical protein n=1 Tax=Oligoflexus sp. TaxID=1971216 RepID=UPI002D4DD94C|nr:hypothetical protein [Oligoflexus sp.]HYX37387.1 hypothetical protein [Oligoflexus sp.]
MVRKSDFRIDFFAPSSGWLKVHVVSGETHFDQVFSHIPYDSVGELVDGLCRACLSRSGVERVQWNAEPDEYIFEFQPIDGTRDLRLTISSLPPKGTLQAERQVLIERTMPNGILALVFWRSLRKLEDGFKSIKKSDWNYAFPSAGLAKLEILAKQISETPSHKLDI